MKKLFTMIVFFMSFFFLVSSNVRADTISYELNDNDLTYINEDFFTFRERVIDYSTANNKYYVITYEDGKFLAYFFGKAATFRFSHYNKNMSLTVNTSASPATSSYYYDNNDFVLYKNVNVFIKAFLNSGTVRYYLFLDTNVDNLVLTTSGVFEIKYKDVTYSIEKDNHVPSLYEIYLDSKVEPEDPQKKVLTNFYTIVIEKISYLSTCIVNDYILLTIFGIFIFIFVIELIFRRWLL